MFSLTFFGLGRAQKMSFFLFLTAELSNRNVFGNVIHLFCTSVRQKIVRGRGSSNINLRLFVFAPLMFLRFITTFPFINYAHT